ncbi:MULTISPECIES: hypothetical protein [Rhizobium]|uniref:hypothetical protein n=1 Tax=Rhizobium TaxID=379 RepID=UPI00103B6E72|nr:hypothetical protein [Rhizobium leguminosarum]TBZ99372.1 hypothetical protein E0H57_28195 [Rhizobium leguminosarum bv. viciae]UFW76716.1 hypothetical protein RlegSU303_15765 [Rhizobium leguminosarum bv. viciae]
MQSTSVIGITPPLTQHILALREAEPKAVNVVQDRVGIVEYFSFSELHHRRSIAKLTQDAGQPLPFLVSFDIVKDDILMLL